MTTLKAHTVLSSIASILSSESDGRFSVVGYKQTDTDENESLLPIVSVTIPKGVFDTGGSAIYGPFQHDVKCNISIIASCEAEVDLNTINDPEATAEQKINAISAMKGADEGAQALIHSVVGDIFNILNSVENFDLGQTKGTIKKRSLTGFEIKEDKIIDGELVTVFCEIDFNFSVIENITGLDPVVAESPILDGSVEVFNDKENEDSQSMDLNAGTNIDEV